MRTISLEEAIRDGVKHTCGPDDGSNEGPWIEVPAAEIDGPRVPRIVTADERARAAVEGEPMGRVA